MIKIFCITHKIVPDLTNNLYVLMQAGAENDVLPSIVRDNTLDNIADKNPNYSELTAAYWLWKNVRDIEYIGLCHYRRYFDLFTSFGNSRPSIINLSKEAFKKTELFNTTEEKHKRILLKYLKKGYVIVPKPIHFPITVEEQYAHAHHKEHMDKVVEVILRKQPEYKDSIEQILKNKTLRICNMFVSSKQFWDEYHEWLFTVFFELEKEISIPDDFYQQRVYAFLSERLFNFYLLQNKVKIKEYELFFIEY